MSLICVTEELCWPALVTLAPGYRWGEHGAAYADWILQEQVQHHGFSCQSDMRLTYRCH